jgi:exopolysaccharide biosynthesis polyprenyl glycosylphosphotransferase
MNRIRLIVFADFVAFLIAFFLLVFLRFDQKDYVFAMNSHFFPFVILYISWVLIFYVFGLYDLLSIKPTIPYLRKWILAIICSFAVGILLFYFVPIFGIAPKINLLIQVAGFGAFSFFFRRMIYTLFSKTIVQPTILIGNSSPLSQLKKTISINPQIGLEVINHFQSISDINLDTKKIKNLLIILDKDIKIEDKNILNFYSQGVEIIDTAKAYEKYLYKIPVEYIDLSFVVEDIDIKKDILYSSVVFVTNIIFSIIILVATSPFLMISALFIYFYDKGPIFYTQDRVGLNGKIFRLYKLRSMIIQSEKNGAVWATGHNDPRVTPIGRIIRKLHIDEIPQMINIIKGDISLVGPRPERPEFVNLLNKDIPYYSFRHIIRPGFTGWAQIKYMYANTVENSKEKFEYDLYYIKNKNIFIDFGIILRTIQIIFTH